MRSRSMTGLGSAMTTADIITENLQSGNAELHRFLCDYELAVKFNENSYVSQMVRTIKYFSELA